MSSSLSHEVPWGAQGNLWPSPGKLMRRVLSEERGGCCSPRPGCATPGPRAGARRTRSIAGDSNLLSPQTRINLPLPLGLLSVLDIGGLSGVVESSCSNPREAMNLVHVRRISRGNRTASWFQHTLTVRAPSKRYVRPGTGISPGRCPWYSCPVRLAFRCSMHHAEGRVATPKELPRHALHSMWYVTWEMQLMT